MLAYAPRRRAGSVDDVVAEVFLTAWRRLDEVPAEPLPWLLAVARRVLANQRRGERRAAALRERIRHDQGSSARSLDSADAGSPALRALWSLSESDQELLMLIAWDGLTRAQATSALGISRGTLAVRLHRARQRLTAARAVQSDPMAGTASAVEATK